jgi:hypothetical protein
MAGVEGVAGVPVLVGRFLVLRALRERWRPEGVPWAPERPNISLSQGERERWLTMLSLENEIVLI